MKHYKLTIHGKVQGVFYRASTKEKAEELGVKGFVRNEPDGTVYIEAEADPQTLEKFIAWCGEGSPAADPTKIDKKEDEVKNFTGFRVEK